MILSLSSKTCVLIYHGGIREVGPEHQAVILLLQDHLSHHSLVLHFFGIFLNAYSTKHACMPTCQKSQWLHALANKYSN